MPTDIQCPDCEHVFGVPASMAGKRTRCRSCNAALIVPGESAAASISAPRESRGEETLPNWDTPIPFRSPEPIVGVLLIGIVASIFVLIIYGIRQPSSVATKSPPYTVPIPAASKTNDGGRPDPRSTDVAPAVGYDREVILPDQETVVPKYGPNSKLITGWGTSQNWLLFRETAPKNTMFHLHDRTKGGVATVLIERSSGVINATHSPSGRWLALYRTTPGDIGIELYACRAPDEPALKWNPYAESGDAPARRLAGCAFLSDERLLTFSTDGSMDLWAIPSGIYIRGISATRAARNASDWDRSAMNPERSLLANFDGVKLEVHSLEDDAFGPTFVIDSPARPAQGTTGRTRFTTDGKRIVIVTPIAATPDTVNDRVELFDSATGKRITEWTIPSDRDPAEPMAWSVGIESLLVHRPSAGTVTAYRLADGKLIAAIERTDPRKQVALDAGTNRILMMEAETLPARSFGFNLPLRTPTTIRKNPVWEYKAGVLELKKVAR